MDRALQAGHFEFRYRISADTAQKVRDFVSEYLVLDPNSVGRPDFSYSVHSYHLDSDDWKLYWKTADGDPTAFHLRLRFYNDKPQGPVYLETKRWAKNSVQKHSSTVKAESLGDLLAGCPFTESCLVGRDPEAMVNLRRFQELMLQARARPRVHIAYRREAWINPDDQRIRVTFDRSTRCALIKHFDLSADVLESAVLYGSAVVLELKFSERFPKWFEEMVNSFRFSPGPTAKFVDSVKMMLGDGMQGGDTTYF